MKKGIIYSGILSFCVLLSSCNSWLDVEPKTEIKGDKMFENESGFKDALIGCYMLMAESSLYGKEMTVCFLDVLAQQYELTTSNNYKNASEYNYENTTSIVDGIWQKTYRIIANINYLLEMLEERKDILHPTNYAIIKGEAIGLRAFLHFDLLRIFGWGNLVNEPANLEKLCIPYVTEYSKVLTKQSTVKEILSYIHKDLDIADQLLNEYDSYGTAVKNDEYELPNNDGFYTNRRNRFNYYAVKATQSRVYMWEGKYQEALNAIEDLFVKNELVSWVNPDNSIHVEENLRDLSYTVEHIFNLDVNNMYESLRPYVEKYQIKTDFSVSDNQNYFYITKANGELLYEIADGTGLSDFRYTRGLDKTDATAWTFLKFYEATESKSPGKNKMPLIRKPEIFYNAAECYNKLGDTPKAIETLNRVRVARGILYEKNLPNTLSSEEVNTEIQKEWKKEFIGEGQMFFYYKRLGLTIPNASLAPSDRLFVLPLPEEEIEIGGREDYKQDKNQ